MGDVVEVNYKKSSMLFSQAQKLMPGGVSSPARAFSFVEHVPPFIKKASGSRLWDEDNNEYIDFVCSWGSNILGHADSSLQDALILAAANGFSFGASTSAEIKLAELIRDAIASVEKVRFVCSGTEACMTAVRLARGFTSKNKIIKFIGHYHGHSDALLANAGSGVSTLSLPDSAGVPQDIVKNTLCLPFQDSDYFEKVFISNKDELAAVIVEPIVGNSGMIIPSKDFLLLIQKLCKEHGVIFICDEVMTGFRVSWQGAQGVYGLDPDISIFGKVISGGLPLAAVGGRSEIMDYLAPLGPVYQAGTLSGNPLAVAVGIRVLEILKEKKNENFKRLSTHTSLLAKGLKQIGESLDIPIQTSFAGGMFGYFFNSQEVKNAEDAKKSDAKMFRRYFLGMLKEGFYLPPSPYEAVFVSLSHTYNDIERFLSKSEFILRKIRSGE
jgi:glutamate-1-semialdehyde 2,1-aminomutase